MLGLSGRPHFVLSSAALPDDPSVVVATTDHGGRVVAAVDHDRVWAAPSRPEKSSVIALSLQADFVDRAEKEARAA